jgi:hypothetical protein
MLIFIFISLCAFISGICFSLLIRTVFEDAPKEPTSYIVTMHNGKGWETSIGQLTVDSVTATTKTSADVWINGHKTTVHAESIIISN